MTLPIVSFILLLWALGGCYWALCSPAATSDRIPHWLFVVLGGPLIWCFEAFWRAINRPRDDR